MTEPTVSDDLTLTDLGYSEKTMADLKDLAENPHGLILFVGAPGSGRSTGLFTGVSHLMSSTRYPLSVATVAKEAEKHLSGADQIPLKITSKSSEEERLTAFRTAMKRASDVIALDLITSPELASEVFRAVKQGQKVFGSIPGRDITTGLDALVSLGIPEHHVYDPDLVTGIVAQRLIQTLCHNCKTSIDDAKHLTDEDHARLRKHFSEEDLKAARFIKPNGCVQCKRGLSERTSIVESIITGEQFMDRARNKQRARAREIWKESMSGQTMLEHAKEKVRQGIIDPLYLLDRVPSY